MNSLFSKTDAEPPEGGLWEKICPADVCCVSRPRAPGTQQDGSTNANSLDYSLPFPFPTDQSEGAEWIESNRSNSNGRKENSLGFFFNLEPKESDQKSGPRTSEGSAGARLRVFDCESEFQF